VNTLTPVQVLREAARIVESGRWVKGELVMEPPELSDVVLEDGALPPEQVRCCGVGALMLAGGATPYVEARYVDLEFRDGVDTAAYMRAVTAASAILRERGDNFMGSIPLYNDADGVTAADVAKLFREVADKIEQEGA